MVNKFREGRVLVAGEAAHVHSATGGQGLNTGIQDAVNLGWKLALVAKHKAPVALLDSYSQERLPVVATMLQLTSVLMEHTLNATDPKDMRGLAREFALRQFGVNYRRSPIIVDEYAPIDDAYDPYRSGDDGRARAGDRAPDGVLGERTLYDIFGSNYHTVLVFAPDVAAAGPIVRFVKGIDQVSFKATVVLPESKAIYDNYRVKEGEVEVAIVRPDSWIGGRVGGIDGIQEYLKVAFLAV